VWFVTHDEANHRHAAQSKPSGVNFLLPMYVTAGGAIFDGQRPSTSHFEQREPDGEWVNGQLLSSDGGLHASSPAASVRAWDVGVVQRPTGG